MGKDFQRSFGIEIECVTPGLSQHQIAQALRDSGIPCLVISRANGFDHHSWAVKGDGSLQSEHGVEIVSPPLRFDDPDRNTVVEIERVCRALNLKSCFVNSLCGLHVHVDVKRPVPLNLGAFRRLARLYIHNEMLLDSIMAPVRRGNAGGNRFCNGFSNVLPHTLDACSNLNDLVRSLRPSLPSYSNLKEYRYVKLNFIPVVKHGTVEFRHHGGTLNSAKIINWVFACQRMVDYALESNEAAQTRRMVKQVRRGSKREIIYNMLLRPEGCTHSEVLEATGWRQVSVAGVGHQYGLIIDRRHNRYFARLPSSPLLFQEGGQTFRMVPVTDLKAQSIDELCKGLRMDEDEISFWKQRTDYLRAADSGRRLRSSPFIEEQHDEVY